MKGSIKKRSECSWTIRYDLPRDDGRRVQKSRAVKGTKRDAERELARILTEINEASYVDPSKITVKDLMLEYLAGSESRLDRKTHLGYTEKSNNYIIPHLGRIQVDRLSASRIDQFLSDIQRSGGRGCAGVSSQTAHHCRAILRAAYNWGIRKELLNIRVNPVTRTDSIKITREEMQILTPDECNRLIEAAAGSLWEMPIALSLYSGMRQGECLGLHWSEVGLTAGTIKVNYSLECIKGELSLKEPKNATSRRTFEITPELVALLKKHKEIQDLRKLDIGASYWDQGLVCAMEDGGYMRVQPLTRGLQAALKQAGVRKMRFHDLRHTHISISLANGESILRVSRRVGHASPTITLNRYAHTIPGDMGAPTYFANALHQARRHGEAW